MFNGFARCGHAWNGHNSRATRETRRRRRRRRRCRHAHITLNRCVDNGYYDDDYDVIFSIYPPLSPQLPALAARRARGPNNRDNNNVTWHCAPALVNEHENCGILNLRIAIAML